MNNPRVSLAGGTTGGLTFVVAVSLIMPTLVQSATPGIGAPGAFSCRASALRAVTSGHSQEPAVANAAEAPCQTATRSTRGIALAPLVSAELASAETSFNPGGVPGGQAQASATNATIKVASVAVTIQSASAQAAGGCLTGGAGGPSLTSSSSVASLSINGGPAISANSPTTIPVSSVVTIYLNRTVSAPTTGVTRRALEVSAPLLGTDLVLGEATADVESCTTKLTVSGFPSSLPAGVQSNVTVRATDSVGTTTPYYHGTVHFTSTDPIATLPVAYTFTAADAGVHTFTATLRTPGSQSVTATDTVFSFLTGTQAGIVVTPAFAPPPLDTSAPTSVFDATSFLYTGQNATQLGVPPGTIQPTRAAVVRGKVTDRSGNPLPGVSVAILGHPEYGSTLTRSDGYYDLAVNGGAPLVIVCQKSGYLTVERQLDPTWQDYAIAPDVAMSTYDTSVTGIDFTQPIEVHRGTVQTDADGTRQATLMFQQGTTATMTLPNGSVQTLSTIHVRATEFTVGLGGPAAMPAELPSASHYTYAVALTADEAEASGASRVSFSKPVIDYLENFLGFPTGTTVPLGSLDATKATWVPENNGHVVKILSITNGEADLDVDGSGQAASVTTYAAMGITDAERAKVAQLYAVGQTLWRSAISHFTFYDCNWSNFIPTGATPPNQPLPPRPNPNPHPCDRTGSVIGCDDRSLGEAASLAGTPLSLHYLSSLQPGREHPLHILLSGSTIPTSLRGIELSIAVAGATTHLTFNALPNESYDFQWDGTDSYGRILFGAQTAHVVIYYVYTAELDPHTGYFGQLGSDASISANSIAEITPRTIIKLAQSYDALVEGPIDSPASEVGGWRLDVHHVYDPISHFLYRGDGTIRQTEPFDLVLQTVSVSNGGFGFTYRGSTSDPAGGIFVGVDTFVAHFADDGTHTIVAGQYSDQNSLNDFSPYGDGGAATHAHLAAPESLDRGSDGSLYIADRGSPGAYTPRVRVIRSDGTIATIAGGDSTTFANNNCTPSDVGDGGRAVCTPFSWPDDLAVAAGPDGNVYVMDSGAQSSAPIVWRISTDGRIHRFAGGTATTGGCEDGPPTAVAFHISHASLMVTADGVVYVSDGPCIWRVRTDGFMEHVAGTGQTPIGPDDGDGGSALNAPLRVFEMAAGADGSLYATDQTANCDAVRKVTPAGIIVTSAGARCDFGNNWNPYPGQVVPATSIHWNGFWGLTVSPDGQQLMLSDGIGGIARARLSLPYFSGTVFNVPSSDGSEVYEFSASGRHLATLDALTGATRYAFTYDSAGRLSEVKDGDGNATTISRDVSGNPTAIVASGGQTTALSVDSGGYLSTITDPVGGAVQLTTSSTGLLASFHDARGDLHTFTYDAMGHLTQDNTPTGATKLTGPDGNVTLTDPDGRQTVYTSATAPDGSLTSTVTDPSGAIRTAIEHTDGTETFTSDDGSVVTDQQAPDPRWKMAAPFTSNITMRLPSGATSVLTESRSAVLSDPTNLFSLQSYTEAQTLNGQTTSSVFDLGSHTATITTPAGRKFVITFDSLSRGIRLERTGLDPVTYTYQNGLLVRAAQGSASWTLAYDPARRLTSETAPTGALSTYGYDAAAQVTQVTTPIGQTFHYGYDADGNRTSILMPNGGMNTLGYTWDRHHSSYAPPGASTYGWTFDASSQLNAYTLPDGRTITNQYDGSGRLIGQTYPEANLTFSYGDSTPRATSLIRSPGGGSAQRTDLGWDGPLITAMAASGGATGTVSVAYDSSFNPSYEAITSGADSIQISIGRDADGLVTSLGGFALSRNTSSLVSSIADATASIDLRYDGAGQVTSRALSASGTNVYQDQISRDPIGRITQRVDSVSGVAHTYAYSYDADGQLIRVTFDGQAVEQYTYDGDGNRTSRLLNSGTVEDATYDSQDRISARGATNYQFDADGFLTSRGSDTFTYSTRGELLQAVVAGQTVSYGYDALGRRVTRTDSSGTEQYLYGLDLFQPVASRDALGMFTTYYYDDQGFMFAMRRGGSTYYVATDDVGSPRVISDASGHVVRAVSYDAFGDVTSDSNPGFALPVGFGGGLQDPVTGLVRLGFRDYEPTSGRWTARDPMFYGGQQVNLYAYVGNNPVSHRDPTGLFCVGGSAYAGLGGGATVCVDGHGGSVCSELGVGLGDSFDLDPWGAPNPDGINVVGEAKVGWGPISLGDECKFSICTGNLSCKVKSTDGPVKADVDLKYNPSAKLNLKLNWIEKALADTWQVKHEGKLAFQGCARWP